MINLLRYSVNEGNDEYACKEELAKQSFLKLINPVVCLSGRLVNILLPLLFNPGSDGKRIYNARAVDTSICKSVFLCCRVLLYQKFIKGCGKRYLSNRGIGEASCTCE